VNLNVNFNTLLSKYIAHPSVKIKRTLIIKMYGITVKKMISYSLCVLYVNQEKSDYFLTQHIKFIIVTESESVYCACTVL
jgi:hypothetical protein